MSRISSPRRSITRLLVAVAGVFLLIYILAPYLLHRRLPGVADQMPDRVFLDNKRTQKQTQEEKACLLLNELGIDSNNDSEMAVEQQTSSIKPPFRMTDPRWDGYVIGLKTGFETAANRVPIQLVTFLQGVRHIWLFGDREFYVSNYKVTDVVTGSYEYAEDVVRKDNNGILPEFEKPLEEYAPVFDKQNERLARKSVNDVPNSPPRVHVMPPSLRSKNNLTPDETSKGWKDDAKKNLPAYRELYYRYPHGKWYIMIDDDSYLFMENLHLLLGRFNHSEPWYLGAPNHFRGCDGVKKLGDGPPFGHGGSGIVLSRGALHKLVKHTDECILKYNACWAGDIRIGLCLRDLGVLINITRSGRRFFNAASPHWNDHPYYEDPCKRVISFHHLKPDTIQKLYSIELLIHNFTYHKPPKEPFTPSTHPHLFSFTSSSSIGILTTLARPLVFAHLPQHIPSPFYAPVHLEDLWHEFVDMDPSVPNVEHNTARIGEDFLIYQEVSHWSTCRQLCIDHKEKPCRAWELDEKEMCRLKYGIPAPTLKKGSKSGILKKRFHCKARKP